MRPLAALFLLLAAGCQAPAPTAATSALDAEITVQRVSQVFPLGPGGSARLIPALSAFAGGRMDALHLALPPGSHALRTELVVAGVRPRKMRTGLPGEVLAERYLALVPPCPSLELSGAAFGDNLTRPGFGCASLANFAAETSDPSDLLGNASAEPPDARRSELPVARWREPPQPPPQPAR